jgi:alkylhydroperoxidase/carboxymuconolactone decarboxylase family protein YurZ
MLKHHPKNNEIRNEKRCYSIAIFGLLIHVVVSIQDCYHRLKKLKNIRMVLLKQILLLGFYVSSFIKNINAQQTMSANQSLNIKQQAVIPIAAYTAKGDLVQLQKALNEGLDAGLTVNETKEVLIQLYAYAGFPRSLNGISTLETVINERKQKGIEDIAGKEPSKELFENGRFEYGKNVQTQLTGTTATGAAQKFVPVIDTFLKEHLFADIFSRDVLDYQTREIVTISALASLSDAESQLQAHINMVKMSGLQNLN